MIVEVIIDAYESKLHELESSSVENGQIIGKILHEQKLLYNN